MGLDGKGIGPVQDTPSYHHEQLCQVIWNSMYTVRSYAPNKMHKAIFWPLTLLCDLDHDIRYVQDMPSYHVEQMCQVIWNSMLAFRSYAPHKVQKAIFWPLTLLCDLDHEARLPKHVFCTSSWSGQYSCQIISKSFKRFERYRADTICDGQTDGRTDRRTDGRTTRGKTICLPHS